MANGQLLIRGVLQVWKFNEDRIDKFFRALSEEELQREIMPGRNRLIYLWGHIAAVNDALFPLLGLGPKMYPDLDTMFLPNPDRAVQEILSGHEVGRAFGEIHRALRNVPATNMVDTSNDFSLLNHGGDQVAVCQLLPISSSLLVIWIGLPNHGLKFRLCFAKERDSSIRPFWRLHVAGLMGVDGRPYHRKDRVYFVVGQVQIGLHTKSASL